MQVNSLIHGQMPSQYPSFSNLQTFLDAINSFHSKSGDRLAKKIQIENCVQRIIDADRIDITSTDLGKIFLDAINNKCDDGFIYQQILRLQAKIGDVPAQGPCGLGRALIAAIKNVDTEALYLISNQNNYNNISALKEDDPYGLNFALLECLKQLYNLLKTDTFMQDDETFLKAIISHSNARYITNIEILDPEFNPLKETRNIANRKSKTQVVELIDRFLAIKKISDR